MKNRLHILLLALLFATACSKQPPSSALSPALDLTLRAHDEVKLAATLYKAKPGAPALVLVHSLGSNRAAWQPFALRAQQAGYNVIAFDMRGHGQSTTKGAQSISYRSFSTEDWLAVLNDIDAARQAVLANGADADNTIVMGASIGANLALHYAAAHSDVPAVVMISPGLDYRGVKTLDKLNDLGRRPVLLMSATGDTYSASSAAQLKNAAPGLCEQREYAGTAHGTDLLDVSETALNQVFLWLKPIIGPPDPD